MVRGIMVDNHPDSQGEAQWRGHIRLPWYNSYYTLNERIKMNISITSICSDFYQF